jgi:hypothetical protein
MFIPLSAKQLGSKNKLLSSKPTAKPLRKYQGPQAKLIAIDEFFAPVARCEVSKDQESRELRKTSGGGGVLIWCSGLGFLFFEIKSNAK